MQADLMSQTRLRAWLAVAIWSVVGVGFAVAFFAWGGPADFGAERVRVVAGAVAIGLGYVGYAAVLWATRGREGMVVRDERDQQVLARARLATLVILLVAVYALSIGLWEAYRGAGAVPVGWLWFLAYGVVIVTFVVHAAATLVVDGWLGGHGRG